MVESHTGDISLSSLLSLLKSFGQYLCKKWFFLLLTIVIGGGSGTLYYSIQKPNYEAVSSFILEEKSAGGGGLAGLASQFGVSLGGLSGGGGLFAGDNILEILESKKVVQHVLLSYVDEKSPNVTLADLYLDFTGIKKRWQKKEHLKGINFSGSNAQLSPFQDSVLNVIYERIIQDNLHAERTSKQGTIIKVKVNAENGVFVRLMSERLVEEASKMYLNIRVGTAQESIRQMQWRADSLLALLNNKSYRVASSQLLDVNPGIKTAVVPVEIASRDKTILTTLYAEVTKNLEASKLILLQQTPVIQPLDHPSLLLDDNKKSLLLLVCLFSTIAAVLYILLAFLLFLLKSRMRGQVL